MFKKKYIPISKCKDGHLYIIDARNADLGVYDSEKKGFMIRRNKFKLTFIDIEYHWDSNEYTIISGKKLSHGTVKPIKKFNYIGSMSDEKLLNCLNNYMKILYCDIMCLKGHVTSSFVLIDEEKMKQFKQALNQ